MINLTDKQVLITGGSRGIGAAAAVLFARERDRLSLLLTPRPPLHVRGEGEYTGAGAQ